MLVTEASPRHFFQSEGEALTQPLVMQLRELSRTMLPIVVLLSALAFLHLLYLIG
jgi:hypothetical protein